MQAGRIGIGREISDMNHLLLSALKNAGELTGAERYRIERDKIKYQDSSSARKQGGHN
jgi:hypothetical protein